MYTLPAGGTNLIALKESLNCLTLLHKMAWKWGSITYQSKLVLRVDVRPCLFLELTRQVSIKKKETQNYHAIVTDLKIDFYYPFTF